MDSEESVLNPFEADATARSIRIVTENEDDEDEKYDSIAFFSNIEEIEIPQKNEEVELTHIQLFDDEEESEEEVLGKYKVIGREIDYLPITNKQDGTETKIFGAVYTIIVERSE